MVKKLVRISIIMNCRECYFNINGRCSKNLNNGKQLHDKKIEIMQSYIGFPEWCPLEDYNGNENE